MLNRSASLVMSLNVLQALPGKLDIKRHSTSILYICCNPAIILADDLPLNSKKPKDYHKSLISEFAKKVIKASKFILFGLYCFTVYSHAPY